jgi:TatA/E family protein of Tat protein translocase
MFGFGHGPELIIILVIALIVLGPGKIPEIAQMLGKGIRELRQASSDLQKTFDVNELMNPTPQPPVPPPMEAASTTETILPPEAAAKPKRTRKRAASVAVEPPADGSDLAAATPSPSLSRKRERDSLPPA